MIHRILKLKFLHYEIFIFLFKSKTWLIKLNNLEIVSES